MPDKDGWVSEAERKAFGLLGRPPDSFAVAPKRLRLKWKELQNLAKRVTKMYDRDRREDYAKHVAKMRKSLVEMMDAHAVSLGKRSPVALFRNEGDDQ